MSAKTRLAVWMGSKKRDYLNGVSIYKDLGVNPERNEFYSTPIPGPVHENILLSDLSRYARVHNIRPVNPKQVIKARAKQEEAFKEITKKQKPRFDAKAEFTRVEVLKNPKVNYDELPDNLKAVYDQFKELYSNYDNCRARLTELPKEATGNPERKKLAVEIVALKKTITANWNQIDSWWNNRDKASRQPVKPSGKMTLAEIESVVDPEIKALSKRMRIEANLKFLTRNRQSTNAKTIGKLEARRKELKTWGVSYAETPGKNT